MPKEAAGRSIDLLLANIGDVLGDSADWFLEHPGAITPRVIERYGFDEAVVQQAKQTVAHDIGHVAGIESVKTVAA